MVWIGEGKKCLFSLKSVLFHMDLYYGGWGEHLSFSPVNVINQIRDLGKTCFDGIWPCNLCKNYIVFQYFQFELHSNQ